jgi:hypothetical protein
MNDLSGNWGSAGNFRQNKSIKRHLKSVMFSNLLRWNEPDRHVTIAAHLFARLNQLERMNASLCVIEYYDWINNYGVVPMHEIIRHRSTYETGTGIRGCEHLSTPQFEFLLEALSPVTNRMGGVASSSSSTGEKVSFRLALEKCLEKLVCDNHRQGLSLGRLFLEPTGIV